ncbi:hypothetical protein GCM10008983_06570 [Lentibacillus halophilus]|uniref:Phage major capsid protein n=1 Tax=Lentibacillus halophilus TaxID=295065 RepID=A0ABN0Z5A2_9BACI
MFTNSNFTPAEQVSLSNEIAKVGVQSTPFTSMLMQKGNIERANSTIYSFIEKVLDNTDDITQEEGADATNFYSSNRKELNNIMEIFSKGVSISGSAQAMKQGQLSQEVNDRLTELKIAMEKKLITGKKQDGSTGKRKMSGLIEFADSSNAVSTTGNIKEQTIKDAMQKLWNKDLMEGEYYALVNADVKENIDKIYENNYNYVHQTTNFGALANSVNTNYGTVHFLLSKHVPANKAVFFNSAYTDLAYLREPSFQPLAKNGDSNRALVVAESTLKVASPKAVSVVTTNTKA